MKVPGSHSRPVRFVAFIAACGFLSWGLAQPPPVAAPPAESSSARPPKTKPQVIYHLPPASDYAAALHSQAKTPHDAAPGDNGGPTPRPAANDAPPKAQHESAAPRLKTNSSPMVREHSVNRHSNAPRSVMRVHPAGKGQGHGNGHGNKRHH